MRTASKRRTDSTVLGRLIKVLALTIWLLFSIFPLYWIAITSFKEPGSIFTMPLQYWPEEISLSNYERLFTVSNFGQYVGNSLLVAFVAATVATGIAMFSGYILARFSFRGRGIVLLAFLVTQMIPAFIALGPLYLMMANLGLIDTQIGITLLYVAMCIPFGSVMMRGFFARIPDSLEEAAMIDGCNRFTALIRVIVPVMIPGIAATFIFNFVNCWNELFLAVTLLNTDGNKTIPPALQSFITQYNIEWGTMSAAAIIAVIPTLVLFAMARRFIVEGLTSGAVKG